MASIVTASLILIGTTGCNFFAPQTTLKHYDASDGVSVTIGSLDVRNALLLSNNTNASLVVTLLNTSNKPLNVELQYQATPSGSTTAQRMTKTVSIAANETTIIGDGTGDQVILSGIGVNAGALLPLYIQYGTEPGKQILVPVLDGTMAEYSTLLPSQQNYPAPSPSS